MGGGDRKKRSVEEVFRPPLGGIGEEKYGKLKLCSTLRSHLGGKVGLPICFFPA